MWMGLPSIVETLSKLENGEEIRTGEPKIVNGIKTQSNKKKMLTGLSVRLMRLFITSSKTSDHLTLDEAAKEFLGQYASASKIKTKVRRLYDITNIFLALNIVEKTMVEARKPAYIWRGLDGFMKIKDTLYEKVQTPVKETPKKSVTVVKE